MYVERAHNNALGRTEKHTWTLGTSSLTERSPFVIKLVDKLGWSFCLKLAALGRFQTACHIYAIWGFDYSCLNLFVIVVMSKTSEVLAAYNVSSWNLLRAHGFQFTNFDILCYG